MPEMSADEKRMAALDEQAEAASQNLDDTAKEEPAPATPGHRRQAVVPPGGPPPPKPSPDWSNAPPGAMATREQPSALVPVEAAPLAETATSAAAMQAKASVEARYVMAWRNPRNDDMVRTKLLRDCKRPTFAKAARYHKPIGKGIEGPSIRFAEAAMRCMGNMLPETFVIYDDDDKRILRVSVTDLETNITYTRDVVVTKVVERLKLRKGQEPISQRTNADGKTTYLVRASEDDLLNKEGALVSKAMRTCALRLVPGDLVDEAMELCIATQRDRAAEDPDAERKSLADAFAGLNITPADLEQYLGHDLSKCSPAQLVDLRGLYALVREGETTWAEVLEASGVATAPAKTGAANLKATLGKK